MNPWDFKPLESLFGYKVDVARIERGDVLFLRPPSDHPPKTAELNHLQNDLRGFLPAGVKAFVLPTGWEIAIGRPAPIRDAVTGLQKIKKDLSK